MLNHFPFVFRFERKLHAAINSDDSEAIMQQIETSLTENKAANIKVLNNVIIYKGSNSLSRSHLFKTPDSGKITLIANHHSCLVYELKAWLFIIIFCGFCLAFSFASQNWLAGALIFILVTGAQYIVMLAQHGNFITKLADAIDDKYGYVAPIDEQPDKMNGEIKHRM